MAGEGFGGNAFGGGSYGGARGAAPAQRPRIGGYGFRGFGRSPYGGAHRPSSVAASGFGGYGTTPYGGYGSLVVVEIEGYGSGSLDATVSVHIGRPAVEVLVDTAVSTISQTLAAVGREMTVGFDALVITSVTHEVIDPVAV